MQWIDMSLALLSTHFCCVHDTVSSCVRVDSHLYHFSRCPSVFCLPVQTSTFSVTTEALGQQVTLENVVALMPISNKPCDMWDLHVGAQIFVLGR